MSNTIQASPADDLQRLFDAAAPGSVICLSPGEYRQKTVIRTPGLTIIGAGAEKTKIVYDDYAEKLDDQGVAYVTFRTYTMAVCADNVTMRDLLVENDALRPEVKGQEVALSVCADGFQMESCILRSTQDTLFLGPLPPDLIARYDGFLNDELRRDGPFRQTFRDCRIEGSVDFIFGCGDALFDRCWLHSVWDVRGHGFVAAPAHSEDQVSGFLFRQCRFTGDEALADGSVYLARPWRDFGMAAFEDCGYGPHIAPEGFDKWNDTCRDKTARFYETPAVPGRASWVNRGNQGGG
ncbi:MAG: pectinesterase family protein [Eubacteriales bacterium]|nr:pectinesterase family protein [Eubacteriales bacterium]